MSKPKNNSLRQWVADQSTQAQLPIAPQGHADQAAHPSTWPKLSETLPGLRDPRCCQRCMATEALSLWIECDEHDKPTTTLVNLCEGCGKLLIEPHPRLYHAVEKYQPVPGAMAHLCGTCFVRDRVEGLTCRHKAQKSHGGPGLNISVPEPIRGFIDYGGAKKKQSGMFQTWTGPATACEGRIEDSRLGDLLKDPTSVATQHLLKEHRESIKNLAPDCRRK